MLNLERVHNFLTKQGFDSCLGKAENGEPAVTATIARKNGNVQIFAIARGARITKPNGTVKYYYEVSIGQFAQYVRQILAFNK